MEMMAVAADSPGQGTVFPIPLYLAAAQLLQRPSREKYPTRQTGSRNLAADAALRLGREVRGVFDRLEKRHETGD